jgi:hypothetical protein
MSLTALPFGRTGMTITRVGFDGWIGAPDLELTTADTTEIAGAVRRTGAGHGRI